MATRCIPHSYVYATRVRGQRKFTTDKLPITEDEGCILCGIHQSHHGSYHDLYLMCIIHHKNRHTIRALASITLCRCIYIRNLGMKLVLGRWGWVDQSSERCVGLIILALARELLACNPQSDPVIWQQYRSASNKVNKLPWNAKHTYLSQLASSTAARSGKFWSNFRHMSHKGSQPQGSVANLDLLLMIWIITFYLLPINLLVVFLMYQFLLYHFAQRLHPHSIFLKLQSWKSYLL